MSGWDLQGAWFSSAHPVRYGVAVPCRWPPALWLLVPSQKPYKQHNPRTGPALPRRNSDLRAAMGSGSFVTLWVSLSSACCWGFVARPLLVLAWGPVLLLPPCPSQPGAVS